MRSAARSPIAPRTAPGPTRSSSARTRSTRSPSSRGTAMTDDLPHRTHGPSWSHPITETQIDPDTPEEPRPATEDDRLRDVVTRLSRPHRSGGTVIERAAILAEGADSTRLVAWVVAHGGQPEAAVVSMKQGLHGRLDDPGAALRPPLRYVLPAD